MPDLDDVYNQITTVNATLRVIHNDLAPLNSDLQTIHNDVTQLHADLQTIITLSQYTAQALHYNAQQNNTMICILENLSRMTCEILNESHLQTKHQASIDEDVKMLLKMYEFDHSQTHSLIEREEVLKKQIESCCPPPVEPPPCRYQPCEAPQELPPPPRIREENPIR